MHSTVGRSSGLLAAMALVVCATLLVAAPPAGAKAPQSAPLTAADPSRTGLYGRQDPTYDGVYRQSISLIALHAEHARVDPAALRWLLRQQCPNGRWTSFRPDLTAPCGAGDSNATALAVIALHRLGREGAASRGLRWLERAQLDGGGWEYSRGWGADTNSTGLALQALIAMGVRPASVTRNGTGLGFLHEAQLRCSAPTDIQGALDYQLQATLQPNDFATAQATQALARTSLPVRPARTWAAPTALDCVKGASRASTRDAAAGYLAARLRANDGAIPAVFGAGVDYGSTANAVLSLVSAQTAPRQVRAASAVLERDVRAFVLDKNRFVVPGAAALLVLSERATRGDARDVNGVDLVSRIQGSITS